MQYICTWYLKNPEFTLNLSKLNVSQKKRTNFSVIILFFILIIKPLPSLLDPVGPVQQGSDCQLHVDELRCLERCANRRWIRRWVEVAKYSELLLGFDSKNVCFFCVWELMLISVKERYDDSELNFGHIFLFISRLLMMLDSASRLICNGTFDEKRMAEEITFEMDFWSGVFFFLRGLGGVAMPWRWASKRVWWLDGLFLLLIQFFTTLFLRRFPILVFVVWKHQLDLRFGKQVKSGKCQQIRAVFKIMKVLER